jgi:hypothetical protein
VAQGSVCEYHQNLPEKFDNFFLPFIFYPKHFPISSVGQSQCIVNSAQLDYDKISM